jgi:phage terminase small subunit
MLTKKQQAFVHEFVTNPGISAKEAAIRAGCSVKRASVTASEWKRDPLITREIDRRLAAKFGSIEKKATSGKVTAASLTQELEEIITSCMEAGPGSWQMQWRLKAIELKAKLAGLLKEKVELDFGEKIIERLEAARKRSGIITITPELPEGQIQ